MKIIHMADVHLDSRMETHLDKAKAKERKSELLHTFTKVLDYAKEEGADSILIAGDLFDVSAPSMSARKLVRELIENAGEIDFYVLRGNHDGKSFLNEVEELENVHLFNEEWTTYFLGDEKKIALYGRELNADNAASSSIGLIADPEKYNIVMLHGQEVASQTRQKAEVIPITSYRNKSIDYMALGHIHAYKYEALDGRGFYCYPGCLEGRGFDECGEHGFVVLEIDEQTLEARHQFVPFARRQLREVQVDVTGIDKMSEIAEAIEKKLAEEGALAEMLIKVVLVGKVDTQSHRDIEYLEKRFEGDFYFFKVKDETVYQVIPEDYLKDASLKGEFVRLVLADEEMTEEMKGAVVNMGLMALSGEELD
ncbi:MAG: exonuclease SbcCD subunit D [Lachnospiraceae bacterium]|nr:exonuclease SbcCD subunit D [Candidatus Merdinaster equi]